MQRELQTFRDPARPEREYTGTIRYEWYWNDEKVILDLTYLADDSCDEEVTITSIEVIECGLYEWTRRKPFGETTAIVRRFEDDYENDTQDLGTRRAVKAAVRRAAGLE